MANTLTEEELKKQQAGQPSAQPGAIPAGQPGTQQQASQPGQAMQTSSQQGQPGVQSPQPAPVQQEPVRNRLGTGGAPKGTGFTNIQRIIGASRGNKLGETIVGGIKQTGAQAQESLNKASQQFQQDVEKNRLDTEANRQQAEGLIGSATQGGELNADQLAAAEKFRAGLYQGPTSLQNQATLAGKAAEAEQLGKLGGSEGGRQGLLQRFVGAPQYSAGQQKLDTLLLGADRQAINQARSATQGLADQAARQIQGAQAQGQQAVSGAQGFKQKFLGDVSGKQGEITGAVNKKLEDMTQAEKKSVEGYNNVRNSLSQLATDDPFGFTLRNKISGLLNDSGLNQAQKDQLNQVTRDATKMGLNPVQALMGALNRTGAQNLTAEGVTDQTQAASLGALSKLAGGPEVKFGETLGKAQAGASSADASKSAAALQKFLPGVQKGNLGNYLSDPTKMYTGANKAISDKLITSLTPEQQAQIQAKPGESQSDSRARLDLKNRLLQERAQQLFAQMQDFERTGQ